MEFSLKVFGSPLLSHPTGLLLSVDRRAIDRIHHRSLVSEVNPPQLARYYKFGIQHNILEPTRPTTSIFLYLCRILCGPIKNKVYPSYAGPHSLHSLPRIWKRGILCKTTTILKQRASSVHPSLARTPVESTA